MFPLAGKTMVVIGGSRGVGRRIAESGAHQGAQVLAVARHEASLRQLAQDVPGIEVLALDATRPNAPSEVFEVLVPDILVLGGGAIPVVAPLHEQSWQDSTVNWESDVRITFHFCKAALSRPLPAGSSVILIASRAALAGSPLTGGYAGAKRTQMLIANYSQKEADRLGLGLQFVALAPGIIPETEFGRVAVDGYARYIGMSTKDFIRAMASPPTQSDVANAVVELAAGSDQSKGKMFIVTGDDVRITFHFCKAALSRPLPAGSSVILIASRAALAGSPLTGGYAGAKRTQMLIANYSQKEADRLGLGLQFVALAPGIIPETEFGRVAVDGYARYIGMSTKDFIRAMASPPTQSDVANAVVELAAGSDQSKGKMFIVTGEGLERASLCEW